MDTIGLTLLEVGALAKAGVKAIPQGINNWIKIFAQAIKSLRRAGEFHSKWGFPNILSNPQVTNKNNLALSTSTILK
ncbi:hypothetical protein GBS0709_13190 [Edwardsiella tarda]|nr:hypothetical protein GBS0709_13190 [Edwardsiella tarda]